MKTPPPPKPQKFPGLEDLDRPELDDDPYYEDEDDTLRCPVPEWTSENVKKVG